MPAQAYAAHARDDHRGDPRGPTYVSAVAVPLRHRAAASAARGADVFESNMPRERFEAIVERIVEYIHAGDAFQVVPSQRWSAPIP